MRIHFTDKFVVCVGENRNGWSNLAVVERVNVRIIFARSCQPENPCANKVPSVRVRFSQWSFGKWRARPVLLLPRVSNERLIFCALKYRLIAPGFCYCFCSVQPRTWSATRTFPKLKYCPVCFFETITDNENINFKFSAGQKLYITINVKTLDIKINVKLLKQAWIYKFLIQELYDFLIYFLLSSFSFFLHLLSSEKISKLPFEQFFTN